MGQDALSPQDVMSSLSQSEKRLVLDAFKARSSEPSGDAEIESFLIQHHGALVNALGHWVSELDFPHDDAAVTEDVFARLNNFRLSIANWSDLQK